MSTGWGRGLTTSNVENAVNYSITQISYSYSNGGSVKIQAANSGKAQIKQIVIIDLESSFILSNPNTG